MKTNNNSNILRIIAGVIIGIIVIIFVLKYIGILIGIILAIFSVYKYVRSKNKKWLLGLIPALLFVILGNALQDKPNSSVSDSKSTKQSTQTSSTKEPSSSSSASSTKPTDATSSNTEILATLVEYSSTQSPGPTENYYWTNGEAKITGFESLKAGDYKFSSDTLGRSSTARAVLTYSQFKDSKGKRQGEPLDPPAWPKDNPKIAISFALTGKTYHGYLFNRSHSIADSLLGAASYSSPYNFTTGTRSQNVGADQNGGMRYAEETVENYWNDHPNTNEVVQYQVTPLYNKTEKIPRGSLIDIKSSDNVLNLEVVVINDAEKIALDYNTGLKSSTPSKSTTKKSVAPATPAPPAQSSTAVSSTEPPAQAPSQPDSSYTTSGEWSIAASGMVFVSDSNKYYSRVTNPGNYRYVTQAEAEQSGAVRAARGNQYARP